MHEQIGTVEILRQRIYPLDPRTADHPLSTSVVVEPGIYPLWRELDAIWWTMTGRVNEASGAKLGDGLFAFSQGDHGIGPELVFPSPRFGPEGWAELLAEPGFTEGHPEQRLRVSITELISR